MFDINDVSTKELLDNKIKEILGSDENHSQKEILVVLNKTDLQANNLDIFESTKYVIFNYFDFSSIFHGFSKYILFVMKVLITVSGRTFLYISCVTGEGVTKLISTIEEKIRNYMKLGFTETSSESVITRSRHRIHLDQANKSLSRFIGAIIYHYYFFLQLITILPYLTK